MKTILVTGSTGTMGQETLKELLLRGHNVRALVLDNKSDRKKIKEHKKCQS